MQIKRHTGSYKTQADAIAKKQGGRCLSQVILSVISYALWKCNVKEHPVWQAQFQLVRGFPSRPGTWCPACGVDKKQLSIEHVSQMLRRRRIKLLSTEYNGVNQPIQCECLRCGYTWRTKYRHIKRGHCCRECAKRATAENRRFTYEYVTKLLKKRRITLLSKTYKNSSSPIECLCEVCGQKWRPRFGAIRNGSGCRWCGIKRRSDRQRFTHEFVAADLRKRAIELLSNEYVDCEAKLRVRFRTCGHESFINFHALRQGRGCPKCAHNARVTREEYEELARARGGQLVAMARTVDLPSTWLCGREHQFKRRFSELAQNQTFCPVCSLGLAERQCKTAVEQVFRVPFRKIRIKELHGVGGGPLELDMYNDELKLALEHNGLQHYEPQANRGGRRAFERQVEHDRRRREYCQKSGITLVEVRELNVVTPISELKPIIKEACLKGGVPLPLDFDKIELNLNPSSLKTAEEAMWERVLSRASEVNYTVVSSSYPGIHGKLQFVCSRGHLYAPTVISFVNGRLCRKCWLDKTRVPVVAFPLTGKFRKQGDRVGLVFDSIEQAAKAIRANPDHLRSTAKGKTLTCKGYGIVEITPKHAEMFNKSPRTLGEFCERQWPDWTAFDSYAKLRRRLSKPVLLSDGRRFDSASEAARQLGVTKASVLGAIRDGGKCRGYSVRQIAKESPS